MDEDMKEYCFVTSYNNFISDHKAIAARIGSCENTLTDEIKERILFDKDSHLKARQNPSLNPTDIEYPQNPDKRRTGMKIDNHSQVE